MGGKSHGPHAFLIDFRNSSGELAPGIVLGDMGGKTVGNDLDNAWIEFNNVRIPRGTLLNRFADIEGEDQYVQRVQGVPVFHMIGQRLFTGRVAVAQAALGFSRGLFASTRAYADGKMCWSPGGQVPLSSVPHLRALFLEADQQLTSLESFVRLCEVQLTDTLRRNSIPSVALVEAIAVAKVRAVEGSISLCHRLKNEVGSYALMKGTGFEQSDFLQCCKFAEGDSRILMQKNARDRMRKFKKEKASGVVSVDENSSPELQLCNSLDTYIESSEDKAAAWDERWEDVNALADAIMDGIMTDFR